MAYTTADARQQLLDGLAEAIDEIALALASLGEAYERLDEQKADKLEQELFRPVQMAYGRAYGTGFYFGMYLMPPNTKHDAIVDGFTPEGPLITTWGETIQLTWEQWNAEAVGMRGIGTS